MAQEDYSPPRTVPALSIERDNIIRVCTEAVRVVGVDKQVDGMLKIRYVGAGKRGSVSVNPNATIFRFSTKEVR